MWAARNWGVYFALEEEKLVKYGIERENEEEFQFYDLGGEEEA